jgi:hypothetical protein
MIPDTRPVIDDTFPRAVSAGSRETIIDGTWKKSFDINNSDRLSSILIGDTRHIHYFT